MTTRNSSRHSLTSARYTGGRQAFDRWTHDVHHGTGPVLYRHTLSHPEIGPGLVTLIGGAPGGGKTALLGNAIQQQFGFSRDWPFGSAIACLAMGIVLLGLWFFARAAGEEGRKTLL